MASNASLVADYIKGQFKPGVNTDLSKDTGYQTYQAELDRQRRIAQAKAVAQQLNSQVAKNTVANQNLLTQVARFGPAAAADTGISLVNAPIRLANDAVALAQLVQPTRASIAERSQQAAQTLAPGGGIAHVGGVLGGRELTDQAVFLGPNAGKNIKTTLSTGLETGLDLAGLKLPFTARGQQIFKSILGKLDKGEPLTAAEQNIITDKAHLLEAPRVPSGQKALQAPSDIAGGTRYQESVTRNPRVTAGENPGVLAEDITPLNRSQQPTADKLLRLDQINKQIRVAQLNGGLSAEEARALVNERRSLIDEIQNPSPAPVAEAPSAGVGSATKTAGQGIQKEKTANLDVAAPNESVVSQALNITNEPVATAAKKTPGVLRRAALSVKGQMTQFGEAGKNIAQRLSVARDTSETGQAAFLKQIPTVTKLKKSEFTQFVDALDSLSRGETPKLSAKVQQAVNEWSQAIPKVRQAAEAVGIDVGDLGPYYFPRDYTQFLSKRGNLDKAAKQLVDSGKAENIGQAQDMLKYMKRQYDTSFGHFEQARTLDLPSYDKSKNALVNYVSGAFNKIAHAEQFGPKGEIAQQLIDEAARAGYSPTKLHNLYQIGAGIKTYDRPLVEDFSKSVRAFNRLRSLGTSAILNAGQTANTIAVGGVGRTSLSIGKFLNKADRGFVKDTGVISDAVLRSIREQTGIAGKVTNALTAPFFNSVEKFNRGVAAITGRDIANSLAAKAARGNQKALRTLQEEFGVTGDIGPTLTYEQQIQAGRNMVERTQFKVDPQDLPAWANSPEGKMVAQFRTFTYKQTRFIYDELLKKAARGIATGRPQDVLPLMRFITIGSAIGYLTGETRAILRSQPFTSVKGNQEGKGTSSTAKFIEALNNVGGFGIGSSALFIGQNLQSQRLPQYVTSTIGGPTAGLTFQTLNNVSEALRGSPKNLERQGLQSIPIAGPFIANKAFPFLSGWEASDAKSLTQFKQKVGDDKFKEAEQTYNDRFSKWYSQVRENPDFKSMTLKDQTNFVSDQKQAIRDDVLRDYGFVYKPQKKSQQTKDLQNRLKYRQ